jgi:hypothetical protein
MVLQCERHGARAGEVLADLHGRAQQGGELGACDVIVVAYWLLDPVQALLVKLAAALAGGAGLSAWL